MYQKLLEDHERIARNWCQARDLTVKWWQETPTRDKIYTITYGASNAITNALVADACCHIVGNILKGAAAEAVVMYKNTKAKAVGVPGEISSNLFNKLSEAEQVAQAPAKFVGNRISGTNRVMEHGKKLALSGEEVTAALGKLEQQGGSIDRFCQAAEKLEHVEGAAANIKTVLTEINEGRIKGAFFELESGLQALERCEEVTNINLVIVGKHGKQEFDVITKTKLIECKNWNWNAMESSILEKRITELESALGRKSKVANETNNTFALHVKYPLPKTDQFKNIWKSLIKNGIELIEG